MPTDSTSSSPRRGSNSPSNRASSSRVRLPHRRQQSSSGVDNAGQREGPSMFESASNFSIHGGRFSAHHGPQASVTVNITQGAVGHDGNREGRQGQGGPSQNSGQNQPSGSRSNINQQESQPRHVQRSSLLYKDQLQDKDRGYPLWIPQPNLRLPISYRKKGVSIGDVGIITPDGAFDFLFNICLPAGDPIHVEGVPEKFFPLKLTWADVREFWEFSANSYVASPSVVKTEPRYLAFESSAEGGALLTMPQGADSQELNNLSKFRRYIGIHAENWYRFVNGSRGREVPNGELRVVVGWHKSAFYGMAVFSGLRQPTNVRLEFNGHLNEHGQVVPRNPYSWHHSGTAEVRVGPDPREIEELTAGDEPVGQMPRNQCLFIRTMEAELSDEIWQGLFSKSTVEVSLGSSSSTHTSKLPQPGSSFTTTPKSRFVRIPASRIPVRKKSSAPTENVELSGNIILSDQTLSSTVHPSKYLSDYLFKQFPDARMTITNDRDWSSPLKTISSSCKVDELIARVCQVNHTCLENGIAYFEPVDPGEELTLDSPHISRLFSVVEGHISVKDYLFGSDDDPAAILDCVYTLIECFHIDDVPLRNLIKPKGGLQFDFGGALDGILPEMCNGTLRVVFLPEEASHPIPPELPGHPHLFLPLEPILSIADDYHTMPATRRATHYKSRSVSSIVGTADIDTLRRDLNNWLQHLHVNALNETLLQSRIDDGIQRLASALYRRYIAFRQKEDLDEAIYYYQQISKQIPSKSLYWSSRYLRYLEGLLGLCAALYQRLILRGMFQDFVDLVTALRAENALNLDALDAFIFQLRQLGPHEEEDVAFKRPFQASSHGHS